jgi:hypothetical protein
MGAVEEIHGNDHGPQLSQGVMDRKRMQAVGHHHHTAVSRRQTEIPETVCEAITPGIQFLEGELTTRVSNRDFVWMVLCRIFQVFG